MTQERKVELYDLMIAWICDHISSDKELFETLTGYFGMTREELHDHCIESLDGFFRDKVVEGIQSWEDMAAKYPGESRDTMSAEREREYVSDCFSLYEREGFAKAFWSPYDEYKERWGQPFEVIGRCTEGVEADLSSLPLWQIKFQDGAMVSAYPEEVIVREMKASGCQMEGIE